MSEPTPNTHDAPVSDTPASAPKSNAGKAVAIGIAAIIVAGGSFALYKADKNHAHKLPAVNAVAQSAPSKPIAAPAAALTAKPATPVGAQAKAEVATPSLPAPAAEKPAAPAVPSTPAVQNIAPAAIPATPVTAEAKSAEAPIPAADKTPALTISDMEIEPVDALEHGTYKVSGKIVNPDAKKKIELTAIHALLKDKNGATVQDVSLDLPAKRIMAPGEVRDFSYTVTAKDPSIVRLEVAVDLLR